MLTYLFEKDIVACIREERMKSISLALLASITLLGCGTKTIVVQEPAPTTKAPTITQAPEVLNPEQNFLNGLTYDHPTEVSRLGKTGVIELGRLTCGTIDEGSTISDFVDMANRTGVSAEFIGSLIREAVENFCPENQWFIDSALNADA